MKSLKRQEVAMAGGEILGDVDEQVKLMGGIDKQAKVSDAADHSGDFDKQVRHSGQEVEEVHHSGDVDKQSQMWDAIDEQRKLKKLENRKKQQQKREKKMKLEVRRKGLEKRRKMSAEICELKVARGGGSPLASTTSKRGRSASMMAESSPLHKTAKLSVRSPSVPTSPSLTSSLVCDSNKVSQGRKTRRLTSKVWKDFKPIYHFGKLVKAQCNHCDEILPARRDVGTSCVLRHLDTCKIRRSSDKNKRTCNGGETRESTISEKLNSFCNSGQGVWSELSEEVVSKLSESVVSLVLSNGQLELFACSGIAIEPQLNEARFLTSAALLRAFNDKKDVDHDRLEIQVHHKGNVATGLIGDYDFDREIAVVNITTSLDVHAVDLSNHVEFSPHSKVFALGRASSGMLIAESGILIGNSSGFADSEELMSSTCKIPDKACAGGPLFDFDGNFVGINLLLVEDRTSFLSAKSISERLNQFLQMRRTKRALTDWAHKHSSSDVQMISTPYYSYERDSFGYPKPSKTGSTDGMILVNTFEETFGDRHGSGKGVWSELGTEVSSILCQTVVSLASFSGETRSFACTGLFIEWNGCTTILTSASLVRDPDDETKMVANMKIKVLLPDNQHREGILQHCNLRYNVALVSVKGYNALHSANILESHDQHSRHLSVVAIGRCFQSGILMATCGKLVPWSGNFGNSLHYSTCKITKAGIGGPVVDFNGKFVGMNFYDKKIGTPYLSWNTILKALSPFENRRIVVEADSDVNPKRWPVPLPCWCHPKFASGLRDNGAEDDHRKYRYVNGVLLRRPIYIEKYSPPFLIVGSLSDY